MTASGIGMACLMETHLLSGGSLRFWSKKIIALHFATAMSP